MIKANTPTNIARGLKYLVLFEFIFLVGLALTRLHVSYVHRNLTNTPSVLKFGPLFPALEFESPDATFARFVQQNPTWISYRRPDTSNTVLEASAEVGKTNFARILVENGANLKEALENERTRGNAIAARLLEQLSTSQSP